MAGDYEILQAIQIGDREIVIGEDKTGTKGQRYMTAVGERNDLFVAWISKQPSASIYAKTIRVEKKPFTAASCSGFFA